MKPAEELFEEWFKEFLEIQDVDEGFEYVVDEKEDLKIAFFAGYKCWDKEQANNNIHSYAPYTYQ